MMIATTTEAVGNADLDLSTRSNPQTPWNRLTPPAMPSSKNIFRRWMRSFAVSCPPTPANTRTIVARRPLVHCSRQPPERMCDRRIISRPMRASACITASARISSGSDSRRDHRGWDGVWRGCGESWRIGERTSVITLWPASLDSRSRRCGLSESGCRCRFDSGHPPMMKLQTLRLRRLTILLRHATARRILRRSRNCTTSSPNLIRGIATWCVTSTGWTARNR